MVRAIADGRSRRRHRAELRGGGLETLQDVPAEAVRFKLIRIIKSGSFLVDFNENH